MSHRGPTAERGLQTSRKAYTRQMYSRCFTIAFRQKSIDSRAWAGQQLNTGHPSQELTAQNVA